MSRSLPALILCAVVAAQALLADDLPAPQSSPSQAQSPSSLADARAACATDVQKLCSGVASGGGRIIACLKQH